MTKRFLFVMWEGGGNVPPQLGLARQLAARGHDVHVLAEPVLEPDVRAAGAAFLPFVRAPHRRDRSPASDFLRDFEARTPIGAFAAVRDRIMAGPAQAYAEDTRAAIARVDPHVVAPDWMLIGAAVGAEAARIPAALLVHSLYQLPEPGKPAPGFGLLPNRSLFGRLRDRVASALFVGLFNTGLPAINRAREAFGLPRLRHLIDHFARAERLLCLYSEAFDLPADVHPSNLRFTGPVLEPPVWVDAWRSPWRDDDPRPLVVVSLSTTYMKQAGPLRRCIDAIRSMPVRALVTSGPAIDPATLPRSDNVVVVRSAPHHMVFRDADVIVTHGGMGTTTRALASAVPIVCMPLGRDQDDVAARVRFHGAGIRVGRNASTRAIADAIGRVLADPSYRQNARRLSDAFAADIAAERGRHELEQLASRGE